MTKIKPSDLTFLEPGYYSIFLGETEYTIEPLLFNKFCVGRYNPDLPEGKINCSSFAEALLKLNELL